MFRQKPHPEEILRRHRIRRHIKGLLLFGIFGLLAFTLLYTAYYGEFPNTSNVLTGNAVREIVPENSISIDADLTIPDLAVNGEFSRIEIIGDSNSIFYAGGQEFALGDREDVNIILTDYDGEISFVEGALKLDGKAAGASINGISINPQSRSSMPVSVDSVNYDFLKIKDVFIPSISYTTSGSVELGGKKTVINLDNENVNIGAFYGDLEIARDRFKIDGLTESLSVEGLLTVNAG